MALTAVQVRFWRAYLDSLAAPRRPAPTRVSAGQPGGPELADQLVRLYLDGAKTAGSSLLADFEATGDPVPQVGDHWIALDGDDRPRCLLRTVRVEQHRFEDVPAGIAAAEGEGDRSLASWRRAHAAHWGPHLEAWGVTDLAAAIVVSEFFDLVHTG